MKGKKCTKTSADNNIVCDVVRSLLISDDVILPNLDLLSFMGVSDAIFWKFPTVVNELKNTNKVVVASLERYVPRLKGVAVAKTYFCTPI